MSTTTETEAGSNRGAARYAPEAECEQEVSFGVLNRLAQAVKGFPDGKRQWWICRYEPAYGHYDPDGPFYSREDAVAACAGHPEFGVFGPFRAPLPQKPVIVLPRKPVAGAPSAPEGSPEADAAANPDPAPVEAAPVEGREVVTTRIDKVTITFLDGTEPKVLPGDKWDALFWNLPAIDKFAVPYYVTTESLAKGYEVRSAFLRPDVYALVHAPDTDYVVIVREHVADPREGVDLEPLY
jgi:hypothetical protein